MKRIVWMGLLFLVLSLSLTSGDSGETAIASEPSYVYVDQPYMHGSNNTIEMIGLQNGIPYHGKAVCRGDWWIRPCEWESYCSTVWEYDPKDFYPVSDCETCEQNLISVIVNNNIAPQISGELNQYKSDLQAEGYRVEIVTFEAHRSVDELRALLKEKYSRGLIGALLVGDLPLAWWYNPTAIDNNRVVTRKKLCDLVYADVDGQWLDQNQDGVYDLHQDGSGDVQPDIWIGRLTFSPFTGAPLYKDEVECLKHYFNQNHQWRMNRPYNNQRALVYTNGQLDDPDNKLGLMLVAYLKELYQELDCVTDPDSSAEDYKERLQEDYEMIVGVIHGWDSEYGFKKADGTWGSNLSGAEIAELQPRPRFYFVFHCNSGEFWATPNYLEGSYLISGQGLTAVNSAVNFAQALDLAQGLSIGETFKFEDVYSGHTGHDFTIFGDPSLRIVDAEPFPTVLYGVPTGFSVEAFRTTYNGVPCPGFGLKWDYQENHFYDLEQTRQDNGIRCILRDVQLWPDWAEYRYTSFWEGEFNICCGETAPKLLEEGATYIYRVRSFWKETDGWKISQWSEPVELTATIVP